MISKITSKLQLAKEYHPSPQETIKIIKRDFMVNDNVLIKYENDMIDETERLEQILNEKDGRQIKRIDMKGGHLTPVGAGVRKKLFGESLKIRGDDKSIMLLTETIARELSI